MDILAAFDHPIWTIIPYTEMACVWNEPLEVTRTVVTPGEKEQIVSHYSIDRTTLDKGAKSKGNKLYIWIRGTLFGENFTVHGEQTFQAVTENSTLRTTEYHSSVGPQLKLRETMKILPKTYKNGWFKTPQASLARRYEGTLWNRPFLLNLEYLDGTEYRILEFQDKKITMALAPFLNPGILGYIGVALTKPNTLTNPKYGYDVDIVRNSASSVAPIPMTRHIVVGEHHYIETCARLFNVDQPLGQVSPEFQAIAKAQGLKNPFTTFVDDEQFEAIIKGEPKWRRHTTKDSALSAQYQDDGQFLQKYYYNPETATGEIITFDRTSTPNRKEQVTIFEGVGLVPKVDIHKPKATQKAEQPL